MSAQQRDKEVKIAQKFGFSSQPRVKLDHYKPIKLCQQRKTNRHLHKAQKQTWKTRIQIITMEQIITMLGCIVTDPSQEGKIITKNVLNSEVLKYTKTN